MIRNSTLKVALLFLALLCVKARGYRIIRWQGGTCSAALPKKTCSHGAAGS
jgi:hypothetical protein